MSEDAKAILLIVAMVVGAMLWSQLNPSTGGGCYDGDTEVSCP